MRARCASLTMVESSEPAETCAMTLSNREAIGLDMPAWKRGFCRRIAAVSVVPARGRPEMKWKGRPGGKEDTAVSVMRDRPHGGGSRRSPRPYDAWERTGRPGGVVKKKCPFTAFGASVPRAGTGNDDVSAIPEHSLVISRG